jgi:hypothetical protein
MLVDLHGAIDIEPKCKHALPFAVHNLRTTMLTAQGSLQLYKPCRLFVTDRYIASLQPSKRIWATSHHPTFWTITGS